MGGCDVWQIYMLVTGLLLEGVDTCPVALTQRLFELPEDGWRNYNKNPRTNKLKMEYCFYQSQTDSQM